MPDKVTKTDREWFQQLTLEQFAVCRRKETERPFSGRYHACSDPGVYRCVCCGNSLFSSEAKFDSGTGWPSYWAPVDAECVRTAPDESEGMYRIEVLCSTCDAHLGHVFDDGPAPTSMRYCINSAALKLEKPRRSWRAFFRR